MNTSFQILVPVILIFISGLLMGLYSPLDKEKNRNIFLPAVLTVNFVLTLIIAMQDDLRLELLRFTNDLNILFKTDDLSRLFSVLTAFMYLIAGVYSIKYMKHEGNEKRFYMFYFLSLSMLMGVAYSGNLLTLYIFFEVMSLLSAPMVLHSMNRTAIAAAFKFIYYSITGATLVLVGFFFIYTYGASMEFTPGGVLDSLKLAGNENKMLIGTMLAILGFSSKAGMFPLHAWLPAAHPVAPAPASAVLSGIITKAGVIAIIRFVFYLTGGEFIANTWVQTAWISFALFSVLLGSFLAFREPEIKRRFAYSTVSQLSYIMFGLASLTIGGVIGALIDIVFHSIIKDGLFLTAGAIIYKTGKTNATDLRGIGKTMPITIWCFTFIAIAAVGIPPTGGFISKWFLAISSLSADIGIFSWLGPAIILLSALLSAGYLFPISIGGFFTDSYNEIKAGKKELPLSMIIPILILAVMAVLLGLFPSPLISILEKIAGTII